MFASPTDPPFNNSDRNCGRGWVQQLNRVVQPLAFLHFNVLDPLKGYTALDIAGGPVTWATFGS
jgi:hypothetical protein